MKQELVRRTAAFAEGKDYAIGMTVGDIDYFVNPWCVTRHDMVRLADVGPEVSRPVEASGHAS